MTILILYHLSGMKCFEYYYREVVLKTLKKDFPTAPSYEWFISLIPRVMSHMFAFLYKCRCKKTDQEIYYMDSKQIPVCHNRRIHSNKVFKGMAERGKSSTGWFYGFKLFLIINPWGEIVRVYLTKGNVADNNFSLLKTLLKGLRGKAFADKGFITKYFSFFQQEGLSIITKIRNNMKNKLVTMEDKILLTKRGVIESAFDIMMTICDIEHTRHRSPVNAFTHLIAGLTAYTYLEKLPSVMGKKYQSLKHF